MADENRSVVDQGNHSVKRGAESTMKRDVAVPSIDAVEDTKAAVVNQISDAVKDITEK